MAKLSRSMLTAVIAVVIVVMLCMPINAITFRSKSLYKTVKKVVSKIRDRVNSIVDHFSNGRLKSNIRVCRVKAKKMIAPIRQLSPLVLMAGDGNETNATNDVMRVQITNGLEDEYHPSMVSLDDGKYFLAYENGNFSPYGKEILFTISDDNGKTWTQLNYFELEGNQTYPKARLFDNGAGITACLSDYICYIDETTGYSYRDLNRSHIYLLHFSDISDLTTGIAYFLPLWYLYDEITGFEYKIENISWMSLDLLGDRKVIVSLVGDVYNLTSKKREVIQGPIFWYTDNFYDENEGWIVWNEKIKYTCSALNVAFNREEKKIFTAYTADGNNLSKILCIYFRVDDIGNWSIYNLSSDKRNLSAPSVTLKDGKIYMAVESSNETDTNIVLYESQNGSNWTSYNISVNPNVSEKYPVLYSNSTHLICVYYNESKDIYLRTSPDGKNWSNAFDINNGTGTVVEEYQTADIADSKHIVWTDNRDGNKDLWIAILGEKEEKKGKPKLNIVNVNLESSEKNMNASNVINITYSNTGDENATMVQLFVTSQCIIDGKPRLVNITENSAYIPVIPKNTTKYIRLQWFTIEPPWKWMMEYLLKEFLNKGEYPPTVKYMNITEIIVQLGPCLESNKTVTASIPVTWDEIFGNLGWRQAIIIPTGSIKAGEFFNITVYSDTGPVSDALVIWPKTSTSLHMLMRILSIVPVLLTLSEILGSKVWKLPIKSKYKLLLSLLVLLRPKVAMRTLSVAAMFLASCVYMTDQNGKVQLKAPGFATNIPRPLIAFSYKYRCFGIEMITVES